MVLDFRSVDIAIHECAQHRNRTAAPDPMAKPLDQSVIAPIERARLNVTQSESSYVQQLHKFVACLFYFKLAYRLLYFGKFVIQSSLPQRNHTAESTTTTETAAIHDIRNRPAMEPNGKCAKRIQLLADCLHTIMLYRSDAHFHVCPIAPNNIADTIKWNRIRLVECARMLMPMRWSENECGVDR